MAGPWVRRTFIIFHTTLTAVIFIESTYTLWDALAAHKFGRLSLHAALVSGGELIGAVLFIIPKTLQAGGVILLIIFAVVLTVHGVRAELPILVYAAGVVFIMVHGSGFSGKQN